MNTENKPAVPRLVFMGSPEFAIPSLRALASTYNLVGVVTQPDRPAGRGRTLTPPPVKTLALELDLPLIQPARLRNPEAMELLRTWQPDLIVVAAFGQILRPEVLDLPPEGCLNVHASLLPRWRGAAPIQAAILAGDSQTGITIMRMDPGVDTGPVLSQRAEAVHPDDTAGTLSRRLAEIGAALLLETLPSYLSGALVPVPQNELPGEPTYAPILKKENGQLDLTRPAEELARLVRAFNPWPGAFITWQDRPLKVHAAQVEKPLPPNVEAGRTLVYQGLPALAASDGLLLLEELQLAGKRPMSGRAFLQGARGWG